MIFSHFLGQGFVVCEYVDSSIREAKCGEQFYSLKMVNLKWIDSINVLRNFYLEPVHTGPKSRVPLILASPNVEAKFQFVCLK